jgi:hypothetical protein
MVQVVENRADIYGRVLAVRSDESRPGHSLVTIEVTAAGPVEGYPNLFGSAHGARLEMVTPTALAEALRSGEVVRCRVRRAGPQTVFAERCTATDRNGPP